MRIRNQSAVAWLAAIVVAALCAGAMTLTGVDVTAKPPAANINTAGLGMMQLLDDEHGLVARVTAERNDRQRAQARAADVALRQEKDRAVALAMADADPPLRLAAMRPAAPLKPNGPKPSPLAQRGAVKLATIASPGPPLSLQAALPMPETEKAQPPQSGLLRRVRDVVATVERVPDWVGDAADWIVDLPAQAIPRRLRAARLNVML
jgi:hypothetical protein